MKDRYLKNFRPADIATLFYILMEIFIVLVFMIGRPLWLYLFFFYISAAGVVLLMVAFPFNENPFTSRVIRAVYPVLLVPFFYRALGQQIYLVFDKPFDSMIHSFELGIFGADPAFVIQKFVDIRLNELMHFGYLSYFLLLPSAIVLYLIWKKWRSLDRLILASVISYYFSFLLIVFYPVTGPRFFLDDIYYLPLVGPFFTPFAKSISGAVDIYGASMPSAHCAIAFVVAWRITRDNSKLAIPAIIIFVLICAGAVYGRFHYLTEAVAGVIIGILSTGLSNCWYDRFLKRKEREEAFARIP